MASPEIAPDGRKRRRVSRVKTGQVLDQMSTGMLALQQEKDIKDIIEVLRADPGRIIKSELSSSGMGA
eukprot:8558697-Prorocentrum_lima.AAC.1